MLTDSPPWPERVRRALFGPEPSRPGHRPRPEEEIELTWIALPPYEAAPERVVSGLLLENQGRRTVVGVRAALRFPARHTILDAAVTSEETYKLFGGEPGATAVVLSLPQIRPGARAVLYVTTAHEEMPEIRVTVRGLARQR